MKILKTGIEELLDSTITKASDVNPQECVNIIIVANPLQPADSRQVYNRPYEGGKLIDYTGELHGDWIVQSSKSGTVDFSSIADYTPSKGEYICLVPVVAGGDDGKSVLRLVALVALSFVTAGIATGAIGGSITGASAGAMTAGSIGAAIGVQVAGTLLINHVLPPEVPTIDGPSSLEQSYGVDGPKNVSTEAIPVPAIYGEHWTGGNVIGLFVDNVGEKQQYLNMLIALSEGEIEGVAEITINDQPLSSYFDVQTYVRNGIASQNPIPYFNDVVSPTNRNVKLPVFAGADYDDSEAARQANLKSGAGWLAHTTTGPANRVRLDLTFTAGLGVQHDNGTNDAGLTVQDGANLVIGYRESGSSDDFLPLGAWDTTSGNTDYVNDGTYNVDAYYGEDSEGLQEVRYADEQSDFGYSTQTRNQPKTLGIIVRGNSQVAVRRSFYTGNLDPSKRYEFRFYNSQDDDFLATKRRRIAYLADVNEIQHATVAYNYTALLGLRIKMNDQINSIPKVLSRVKGIKCQVFDEATRTWSLAFTKNPAWIAYDALTNNRYGGGVDSAKIKLGQWREWASFCDTENLEFNGVITEATNLWDGLKNVFRAGRSRLVRAGSKYQVATEKPKTEVMLFSMGNIKTGSMSMNWAGREARANEVAVTYYPTNDGNRPKTLIVQDNAARTRGDAVRTAEIDLRGITDEARARREGVLALNMNKLTQSISFEAPIESIALTLGDVFAVQHDMPRWGSGGRTKPGSTTTVIQLDKEISMSTGVDYELLLKMDKVVRHSNTISDITLGVIYFTAAFDPSSYVRALRLYDVTQDIEVGIEEYVYDSANTRWGVVVSDTTGIIAADSIELWDLDVLETAPVVTTQGEFTSVTLQSPLPNAPVDYSGWAFGEVDTVVRYFTCQSISGDGDGYRMISGLQYDESTYNDTPVDVVSPASSSYALVTNVSFGGWSQTGASVIGNPNRILVTASWSSNSPIYDHAQVLQFKNDLITSLGSYTDSVTFEANEGDIVTIAIIPVDRYGRKPDLSLVNRQVYAVSAQFVIDSPQNLAIESDLALTTTDNYQNNLIFTFDPPDDTYHVVAYEVEYQLARKAVWEPIGYGLLTRYEHKAAEFGITKFRVRTVYVKDVSYSDWAEAQIDTAGTFGDLSSIGLDDPINPKLYISTNLAKQFADIRIEVDQNIVSGAKPENFYLFYSVDDRPNNLQLGTDAGNKLYLAEGDGNAGRIAGEFTLDVAAGSSNTEIRYTDPEDIVDIDLSGLWWVRVESPGNGDTRYYKVSGISTSEIQIPPGDTLPFVPQVGDTVRVLEIDWHDSRIGEFKLGWANNEVIRHQGINFDGDYYIDVVGRGREGTTQQNLTGQVLEYFPAWGPDTVAVKIEMSEFNLIDGVYKYNARLNLDIPPDFVWASISCCYVRRGTTEDATPYVRSNIVPLTVSQ